MQKIKLTKTKKMLLDGLIGIVGRENVYTTPTYLHLYTYDASLERGQPDFVVFPRCTSQISRIVQLAEKGQIPYLPRGAGTNLSGGAVPSQGGIIIALSRLNQILKIDLENRRAVVQPGVVNLHLQNTLAQMGYFYAPDPSSQKVSTIGGNVGENAGGPHCLKYGLTHNHVLGLTVVLPGGGVVTLGGEVCDEPGFDLVGLLVGSEGTLGIVTEIAVRILPLPESCVTLLAIYDSLDKAARSVSQIMATGIIPAALELMDRPIIEAVEDSYRSGFPREAEAVLIIEIDGLKEGLERQGEMMRSICRKNGVVRIEQASSVSEREKLWAGRKGAFGAIARLRPSYMVNDGTVPRTKLPEVLMKVGEISHRYSLLIGNVAHAGDGNLHPVILFDERDEEEKRRVIQAGSEILRVCAEAGGTISGEHGIGLEKKREMEFIFSDQDIKPMRWVKEALDPNGLCNPGKIFPEERTSLALKASKTETAVSPPEEIEKSKVRFSQWKSGIELSPSNPGSLQEILRWAQEHRISVNISGKAINAKGDSLPLKNREEDSIPVTDLLKGMNSQRDAQKAPECLHSDGQNFKVNGSITLSMVNLNRILEFDPENFYISVQAGINCQTLEQFLSKHKLMLPFDPPFPQVDTVGGCLARNYRGLRSAGYGTPRDWVLGLTALLPGLGPFKCGGKTVKNVSGYDLVRLIVGAHGTLGVITEATLRVFPQPETSTTVAMEFGSFQGAMEFGKKLMAHRYLLPSSLLCYLPCLDAIEGDGSYWQKECSLSQLLLILGGRKSDVRRQLDEIEGLVHELRPKEKGFVSTTKHWENDQGKSIRHAWERIMPDYWNEGSNQEPCLLMRVSCLPAEVEGTIGETVNLLKEYGFQGRVLADLPTGIVWTVVRYLAGKGQEGKGKQPKDREYPVYQNAVEDFIEELRRLVIPQRRFVTIYPSEKMNPARNSVIPVNVPDFPPFSWAFPDKLELMTRIKSRFDPEWILNSDRFSQFN